MSFTIEVEETNKSCPTGENVGKRNLNEGKIPVLTCEGGCIHGEIAQLAANMVAKEEPYSRGCFIRCFDRILENILGKDKLIQFDALSQYKKYTDKFDIDEVPEDEHILVAREVVQWVLENLEENK